MSYTADRLEVLNGPEDGAQFFLYRSPVLVGKNPQCSVYIQFDPYVEDIAARVSVVSDGYRIRRVGNVPVLVNNKKVGRIRSRVLRSGGTLRVSQTEMCLICAPEGLSHRSRGLSAESDFLWLLRFVFRGMTTAAVLLFRFVREMLQSRAFWVVAAVLILAWLWRRGALLNLGGVSHAWAGLVDSLRNMYEYVRATLSP